MIMISIDNNGKSGQQDLKKKYVMKECLFEFWLQVFLCR